MEEKKHDYFSYYFSFSFKSNIFLYFLKIIYTFLVPFIVLFSASKQNKKTERSDSLSLYI